MSKEHEILKPIIDEYAKFSYEFWTRHLNSPITFEGKCDDSTEYQVEIQAFSCDENRINLVFSIAIGGMENCIDFAYLLNSDGTLQKQGIE